MKWLCHTCGFNTPDLFTASNHEKDNADHWVFEAGLDVGWTSTRSGMSSNQHKHAKRLLEALFKPGNTFHHGDCLGGDQEGFEIASYIGYFTVAHPPGDPKFRAYTRSDLIMPEKAYISRNHDIVDAADILVACPRASEQAQPRSGTWATVRYARQHSTVPVLEILP